MGWWQNVVDALTKVYEWFNSEKGQETIANIGKAIAIIVQVIGAMNEEPTNERKRDLVRQMLNWLKYADPQDLAMLLEIKNTGALDDLTPEEMDLQCGIVTGAFVKERRERSHEKEGEGE